MRRELHKRGIHRVKVVWSDEPPVQPQGEAEDAPAGHARRSTPGSTAFAPAVAGLMIAGEVVKDLTADDR
jgi:tRNA A37 threonylcarbamoyladenosine dehydratase